MNISLLFKTLSLLVFVISLVLFVRCERLAKKGKASRAQRVILGAFLGGSAGLLPYIFFVHDLEVFAWWQKLLLFVAAVPGCAWGAAQALLLIPKEDE